MILAKTYILLLFITAIFAQSASKGYYFDNYYNLHEIPISFTSNYLENFSTIAVSSYFNLLNQSGWTFLEITTNPSYSDDVQMYAAGYLEGSSTYELIWDAWNNFNDFMLNNASSLEPEAQAFVDNQINWLLKAAAENAGNPYWDLINATLSQLYGMYDGYVDQLKRTNRSDMFLTFKQFYYLTNMGDLEDIIPAFHQSYTKPMECSAFFRLTPNDLIAAHNTFNLYSLMLRVFKSFNMTLNNPKVKAKKMMFSSRPGDLESKDDFYMLDTNLVVVETSLNNYNKTLYKYLNYATVPAWLRNIVANRMASNGQEWADVFLTNRSGTHNNQWMVLDYNKYDTYKTNLSQAEGIVFMVEEFYNLQSVIDVTQELLVSQGYIAGYNVPYNQTIYEASAYQANYHYNYSTDPRAVLFREYGPKTTDVQSVKHLIRYNNVTDTGDVCSAIAPRCDLLSSGPYIFGAIDGKITTRELIQDMIGFVISGPTTQDHPPFDWDKWPNQAQRGMPKIFNFDWVVYQAGVGPLYFDNIIQS